MAEPAVRWKHGDRHEIPQPEVRFPVLCHCGNQSLSPHFRTELLDVVIQREFVRMGPQAHGIRFILALVFDKGLDQVLAEDIAL